jgi:hypothetical protein
MSEQQKLFDTRTEFEKQCDFVEQHFKEMDVRKVEENK